MNKNNVLILCLAVILFLLVLAILPLAVEEQRGNDIIKQNVNQVSQVIEDRMTEISDLSSEVDGEWRGLCKKNSIQTVEDFYIMVYSDPKLIEYYYDFDWVNAVVGTQGEDMLAFVAHRKDDIIKKTKKPIKIPKGDGYITDGKRVIRTFCCNDIDIHPSAGPPEKKITASPPIETLDLIPSAGFPQPPIDIAPVMLYHNSPHFERINQPHQPVPEPNTMLLFASGLMLLVYMKRK